MLDGTPGWLAVAELVASRPVFQLLGSPKPISSGLPDLPFRLPQLCSSFQHSVRCRPSSRVLTPIPSPCSSRSVSRVCVVLAPPQVRKGLPAVPRLRSPGRSHPQVRHGHLPSVLPREGARHRLREGPFLQQLHLRSAHFRSLNASSLAKLSFSPHSEPVNLPPPLIDSSCPIASANGQALSLE